MIVKRLPASTSLAKASTAKQLNSVLGQAAIARFAMREQGLDDMRRMLDFRTGSGLQVLQFFRPTPQFFLRQRQTFGTPHGYVPGH